MSPQPLNVEEDLRSGPAVARDRGKQSINKRRRTHLACTICRQRKTRCDGHRPVCSPCSGNALLCRYEQVSQRDNAKRSYASRAQLARQVRELEDRLRRASSDHVLQGIHNGDGAIEASLPSATDPAKILDPSSSAESEDDAGVDVQATATLNQESDLA